jgi:hypothetical protein
LARLDAGLVLASMRLPYHGVLIYYDGADAIGTTTAIVLCGLGRFCRWRFRWGINLGFLTGYRLERHPLPGALRLIWWGGKGSVGIPDSYVFSGSEHIDWCRGRGADPVALSAACQPSCLWMVQVGR